MPVFPQEVVLDAISPADAIERVRDGFVEYARGGWQMPPRCTSTLRQGDFRAMPAKGAGLAILKWVTSFQGIRGRLAGGDGDDLRLVGWGRPPAGTGRRPLDHGAEDGAVAAVAAQGSPARMRRQWGSSAAACTAPGPPVAWLRPSTERASASTPIQAAGALAGELGWEAGALDEALACDIVTCVTPGAAPVVRQGDLRPGLHLNMLGADGPGKAEAEPEAVAAQALLRRVDPGEPRR